MKLSTIAGATMCGFLLVSTFGGVVHAQTMPGSTITSMPVCFVFSNNIRYGSDDAYTGQSSVTQLQDFLTAKGYFNSANLGTGHFGPLTLAAVEQYQSAHAIPATGFVGPLTRASMNASCSSHPISLIPPAPVGTPTTTAITISSIVPTSGSIGSTITITGSGLTNDNTILFDGNVASRDVVANSSQSLTTTVPSSLSPNCAPNTACPQYALLVTPAVYQVSVENTNGTSNTTPFTVTSASSTSTL